MELDEVKELWQKQTVHSHKSQEDLDHIIKTRSKKPLNRIYRNMLIELVSSVVIVLTVWLTVYAEDLNLLDWILFSALFIPLTGLYFWVYKSTKIDLGRDNVSDTILKLNRLFNIYRKNITICLFGIPVGYVVGYLLAFASDEDGTTDWVFWVGLLAVIPVGLLTWYPLKWLVRKFYGQYISELKKLVAEIKNGEHAILR